MPRWDKIELVIIVETIYQRRDKTRKNALLLLI